jgi:hypothetical protein
MDHYAVVASLQSIDLVFIISYTRIKVKHTISERTAGAGAIRS